MLWAALPFPRAPDGKPPPTDALTGPATWALQFTPRVALVEEAVVMEVDSCTRLFGGRRALRDRIAQESADLGATGLAWATNSLAALALAREGIENGFRRPLPDLLDALPMATLSATTPHAVTLTQLGCRTLGDVRRLPRGGISRRFGKALLTALDQLYGLLPEVHTWIVLPETFRSRLELPARVEMAPALLFGARRLLLQLSGWLSARQAGITSFTLHWAHDAMRSRSAGEGGELVIRTAQPMRDVEHLCRLLAEHLVKVSLLAPAGELILEVQDIVPLSPVNASLLPDRGGQGCADAGESLLLVLERVAARLGPQKVLRPVLVEDHRLEWAQHWTPASEASARQRKAAGRTAPRTPQPTFVLEAPLRLAVREHRPVYQGPLQLLTGPHRVEGGWWHRVVRDGEQATEHVARDYWVALSEHAGVLWIFQERLADDQTAWYLHGSFA
jgi:protein ImuB